MERLGREREFPIIDRLVGELVEVLALSIGATSVFEMGSGYGYSAYWFTHAVGAGGRVICTDSDSANLVTDLAWGRGRQVCGRGPRCRRPAGTASE